MPRPPHLRAAASQGRAASPATSHYRQPQPANCGDAGTQGQAARPASFDQYLQEDRARRESCRAALEQDTHMRERIANKARAKQEAEVLRNARNGTFASIKAECERREAQHRSARGRSPHRREEDAGEIAALQERAAELQKAAGQAQPAELFSEQLAEAAQAAELAREAEAAEGDAAPAPRDVQASSSKKGTHKITPPRMP